MNQVFDPLNIIILVAAVIIFLRLRSVLGTRTGHERGGFDPFNTSDAAKAERSAKNDDADGKVIRLPNGNDNREPDVKGEPVWKGFAEEGSDLAAGLDKIADADPDFQPSQFLEGARIAYEMIITAFNEGDRKGLKSLLVKDVYASFASAVDEREKAGQTVDGQFVGIDKAEMIDAAKKGRKASITVRFISQIIKATLDRNGSVLDGDPNQIVKVTDIWTFERDTTSGDPNWKLAGTEEFA